MKTRKSSGVVKVYEGNSIFEAYSKLKRDLGDKAVILSTRHIKKGGFLGIGGSKIVQITATDNVKAAPRRNINPTQPLRSASVAQPVAPQIPNPAPVTTPLFPTQRV